MVFIFLAYSFLLLIFFFLNIFLKLINFLAALGLSCCVWALSSCGDQRLFIAVHGLLIAVASLCRRAQAPRHPGFSSCCLAALQYVESSHSRA